MNTFKESGYDELVVCLRSIIRHYYDGSDLTETKKLIERADELIAKLEAV